MLKVAKSFICRGCLNPVTSAGRTSVDKGASAKLELFVAEKWVDTVVSVERHSERILVLKMVLGDRILYVFTVYAPHSGRPDEENECFWKEIFHLVSCIPQNEIVVFAGDMNGHVGSSNVGYDD